MEYYIVYDLNDNIIAYCDNKLELSNFLNLRIKDINYKFKNTKLDYIISLFENKKVKIYRFYCEKVERPFFVCYSFLVNERSV